MAPRLSQGTDLCQCKTCGEFFKSSGTFARHRVGDWKNFGLNRRCLTTDEMSAKGWTKNGFGFWIQATLKLRHFPSRTAEPSGDRPKALSDTACDQSKP